MCVRKIAAFKLKNNALVALVALAIALVVLAIASALAFRPVLSLHWLTLRLTRALPLSPCGEESRASLSVGMKSYSPAMGRWGYSPAMESRALRDTINVLQAEATLTSCS